MAKQVEVGGSVEGKPVSCAVPADVQLGTSVSRASMKDVGFAAAAWLDRNDWRLDALRGDIKRQNPKRPLDRIVFLPHLPSGSKALPVVRGWVREILDVLYVIHNRQLLSMLDSIRRSPPEGDRR
jgi:hypothetical protein